jgi:tyrosine-protein phosphatase SIW14
MVRGHQQVPKCGRRFTTSIWLAGCFILAFLCVSTDVRASDPTQAWHKPVVSAQEIPNFYATYPYLWHGAAPTEAGLRALKAQGVHTVIDLRISPKKVAAERRFVESLGLRFINLPMSGDPPTNRQIDTFLKTTTNAADQPVFVHCQHGADRTGTMMAIYRERVDGWDFDRAYKEMRRYGFDPRWKKLTATVRRYAPSSRANKAGSSAERGKH